MSKGQDEPPVVKPKPINDSKPAGLPSDVPVVKQKKREPAEEQIIDQGILPISLISNRVDNIKVGTSAYVSLNSIRIDTLRRCWLHPHALTGSKAPNRPIEVKHDAAGFHLLLENVDHQWEAVDFDTVSSGWIAVRTVTVK